MPTDNQFHADITAQYTDKVLPLHKGNRLIEALPPAMDDSQLFDALEMRPQFDDSQRDWPAHERMQMVTQLFHSMFPLGRHVQLARTIDMMLRHGYSNRSFRSSVETLGRIHEAEKAGALLKGYNQGFTSTAMTKALLGSPGTGKSASIQRVLNMYPRVIYHPEHHVYQVPFLYIETPHDGTSIKGLAHGIFRRLDEVIPGADYFGLYCSKSRTTDETLLGQLSRVLSLHHVGLLVCDEIQNVLNARKERQSVMSLLVSASNEFGVPILFVGTHKAQCLLELDFRQARRSSNIGTPAWDRLNRDASPKEWKVFLEQMWDFQWVKHPAQLTQDLEDALYWHSQGITDLILKLFVGAQLRAIQNGTERITVELIDAVAQEELKSVQDMTAAVRSNNLSWLARYPDLASIKVEDLPPRNLRSHVEAPQDRQPSDKPSFRPAALPLPAKPIPVKRLKKGKTSNDGKVVQLQTPDLRRVPEIAAQSQQDLAQQLRAEGLVSGLESILPF